VKFLQEKQILMIYIPDFFNPYYAKLEADFVPNSRAIDRFYGAV